MMKKFLKKILVLLAGPTMFLATTQAGYTQVVTFGYDAHGNRTMQQVLYPDSEPLSTSADTDAGQFGEDPDTIGNVFVDIAPNPNNGRFIVYLYNLKPASRAKLSLYDLNGKPVVTSSRLEVKNRIDIRHCEQGVFILVITIDGTRKTWKVIRQ